MNVVLFIIAVAFPVVVCVLVTALQKKRDINTVDLAGTVNISSVVTALLLGVIGAVSISGEFAHGTIRPTFAATPKRSRVLIAKAIIIAVFAAVAEALVVAISFSVASAIASSRGASISLGDEPTARAGMIGVVVFAVIVSLLGFGLGMLIRNTPAAVAVLFVWPLVIENIIAAILSAAGVKNPANFLPYVSGIRLGNPNDVDPGDLGRLAGGSYFAAVTAVVAVIGATITARRDA
jgi:ABC-2 type transport system permease protein